MIIEYVTDIARQMDIKLSRLDVVEGRRVGCINVHLLNFACNYQTVSTLVYQSELDNLGCGSDCERLEMKIRSTLTKLQGLQGKLKIPRETPTHVQYAPF